MDEHLENNTLRSNDPPPLLHKCAMHYNSLTARSEPLPSPWVFHRLFNKFCGFLKRFPGDTALRTLRIRSGLRILTFRIGDFTGSGRAVPRLRGRACGSHDGVIQSARLQFSCPVKVRWERRLLWVLRVKERVVPFSARSIARPINILERCISIIQLTSGPLKNIQANGSIRKKRRELG